jgi:ABC-type proline/glycine betaine transport system permease subunit
MLRAIAFIFIAMIIGLFTGIWYASQDRTCALVQTSYGDVILCSNEYNAELQQ